MKDRESCLLYTDKKIDFTKEPMFFGTGKNTQRFEVMKYSWFDKSNAKQQGQDWQFDEITINSDIADYKTKLSEGEKFVIKRGLQRAIFLDSVNGRSPILMFGQVTTLPELEAVITTWTHFECNKHSRTYTKHLQALFPNPSEVFDESFTIPELKKIANNISKNYNEAYKSVIDYTYKTLHGIEISEEEMKEIKRNFIMAWVEVNILEGVRFYPFFSTLWAIHHGSKHMQELTEDIILIARDENEHLNLTQFVLHKFRTKEEEGFKEIILEMMPEIKERFYKALEEEFEWVDYLFSKGSFLGMNANICKKYVVYLVIRRMRAVGIEPDIDRIGGELVEVNPIPWVETYINNDSEEKLPQEENVLNYLVNALEDDLTKDKEKEILNKYI